MYLEVEMECVYEYERRKAKVIVTSLGPYHNFYVNFDSSMRIIGMKFKGIVYSTYKYDAGRGHCILVNEQQKRDPKAYIITYDPRLN